MTIWVTQNVLGLDVPVTNIFSVDIGDRSHQLIGVNLYNQIWYFLLGLQVRLHDLVSCIWNVVHDDIEIHFIGFVTIRVETLSHFHTIWMVKHLQNCQLSIFVSLVLKHLLDGYFFSCFGDGGLENDSK